MILKIYLTLKVELRAFWILCVHFLPLLQLHCTSIFKKNHRFWNQELQYLFTLDFYHISFWSELDTVLSHPYSR